MKLGARELCTERYWSNYDIRLGQVSYAHGCRVIASAFMICLGGGWHGRTRSARGRSGLELCSAEIIEVDCCYEFFGTFGQWLGGNFSKGGAGLAAFRRPWRFFRCRSWWFLGFSSSTECAPLRVNRDRYPQESQFLDKVVERARVMQRQVLEGIRTTTRSSTCQWSCVSLRVLF